MAWTEEQDLLLCREILISQPYKFAFGSRERGHCWSEVANRLNECEQPKFTVDQRAVRERYAKIEKYFKSRMAKEERESGINTEESELDQAIQDIIGMAEAAEEEIAQKAAENKSSRDKDKMTAEDVRKRCMERLSETQEREKIDNEAKKRRSNADTLEFLREKAEKEFEMKGKELELKKREIETRLKELEYERERDQFDRERKEERRKKKEKNEEIIMNQQQQIMALIQQQQHQQQQIVHQMQQQNAAIIAILGKIADK